MTSYLKAWIHNVAVLFSKDETGVTDPLTMLFDFDIWKEQTGVFRWIINSYTKFYPVLSV